MDERRQLPRWEIKKEAKVLLSQEQVPDNCMIEDMHLKGMCVSFKNRLPQEKPLRMSFSIGDDPEFIKVEADVPWDKEDQGRYVYGLSFTKITDLDKEKMYAYINANCYDQFRSKWWA